MCSHNGAQRSGKLYIAMRYLASLTLGRDSLDISDLCPSLPSHGLETLPHWRDVENLNTQDSSIEPCASLPPLSAPAKCPLDILERAAHLLPMLELIDQAQEFRYGLTKDCQRPMLYDMVEIVMRRGMSKLSEREAWREQDESVFATEQVEALHGALYWPWRSVRVKREETKSVEGDLTQEGARKGIEELESEGRYWEEKRVRDEARKAKQSGLGTGEGTGENRS